MWEKISSTSLVGQLAGIFSSKHLLVSCVFVKVRRFFFKVADSSIERTYRLWPMGMYRIV